MEIEQSSRIRICVTGSNKGLGFALVDTLLKTPSKYSIIMTSRSLERGETALNSLKTKHENNPEIDLKLEILDLMNLESIEAFTESIKNKHGALNILVNNAGILFMNKEEDFVRDNFKAPIYSEVTEDDKSDTKIQWETNYKNTKLLTEKLLEKELISPQGRIINVSSGLGNIKLIKERNVEIYEKMKNYEKMEESELSELEAEFENEIYDIETRNKWPTIYGTSKMFLSVWTFLMGKELIEKKIQITAMSPGFCVTDMTKEVRESGYDKGKSAYEGVKAMVFLIEMEYNEEVQGRYYSSGNEFAEIY